MYNMVSAFHRVLCVKLRGDIIATGSSDSTVRCVCMHCLCVYNRYVCTYTYNVHVMYHTEKCMCVSTAYVVFSGYGVWRVANVYMC